MGQEDRPFPASFQAAQRRLFQVAVKPPGERTQDDWRWLVEELARVQKFEADVRVATDGTRDLTGIVPTEQRVDEVIAAAEYLDASRPAWPTTR